MRETNAGAMLELIILNRPPGHKPVVLFETPGSGSDYLAAALAAVATGSRRYVLASPPPDAPSAALRRWHRDAWAALDRSDRAGVALVLGRTAGYLAPVFGDGAELIALVEDPAMAVRRLGVGPQGLEALVAKKGKSPGARATRPLQVLNGQSRALLEPWHDTDGLVAANEPSADQDRWRHLLFEDVLPRVKVHPSERRIHLARRLSTRFAWPVKRATRLAGDPTDETDDRHLPDVGWASRVNATNWLDRELRDLLYTHVGGRSAPLSVNQRGPRWCSHRRCVRAAGSGPSERLTD